MNWDEGYTLALIPIGAAVAVSIVIVVFVLPPSEQLVSGSAIVREHTEGDAVVRAVLDATNRRLPSLV